MATSPLPQKSTTKAEAATYDFIKQQPRYESTTAIANLPSAVALLLCVKKLPAYVTMNRTETRKEPEQHP